MKTTRPILLAVGVAVGVWGAWGPRAAGADVSAARELRQVDSIRDLSGPPGSERFYRVYVPEGTGTLEVTTSGGSGDCDLYVRQGGLPSTASFDRRSTGGGTWERIVVDSPRRGDWYILVSGYGAYRGVSLSVRVERGMDGGDPRVTPLASGVPARGLSGGRDSWRYFSLRVPPGASRLTIRTGGGRGDCDLYVARGTLPTPKSFSYSSRGETAEESIAIPRAEAGTWFILLHGFTPFSGVDLVAAYTGDFEEGAVIIEPTRTTVWRTGREYPVRWRVGREVRRVQVQYSLDGGDTWTLGHLPRWVPAADGVLTVRVPAEKRFLTEEARVRLLDFDRETVLATSPRFRILPGLEPPPMPTPVPLPEPALRPDRFEPDGDADSAGVLRLDSPQTHTIVPRGDQDWLELHPGAGERFVLRFSGVGTALSVTTWSVNARGETRRLGRYEIGRGGGSVRLEAERDTRYFRIKIAAEDEDERGSYTVSATRDGRD